MKLEPSDMHKNKSSVQGFPYCLVGLILVFALALLQLTASRHKAQRIVVLANWSTNGEQLVTFRLEPSDSVVAWAELVPADDTGNAQPPTIRHGWGIIGPASLGEPPNSMVRYDALPMRGASIDGKPLAYTPGTYTVAYTAAAGANRLRAGLALERKGFDDWLERCRRCWETKSLVRLRLQTHKDPVFVTSEIITNVFPVAR
jgi:hypothetical protein